MYVLREDAISLCGFDPSVRALAAFSGGPDSVALLLELQRLVIEGRLAGVFAAHLNHGIRGEEADRDEAFCVDFCASRGIPLTVEKADVPEYAAQNGLSLETAARKVRYLFLERIRKDRGCDCIVTAHHADDQAETVLMHLLRGCGTDGIVGMQYRNGSIARPLLGVTKEEILGFLSERKQPFCTDSSNSEDDALRNRIRHELIPFLESFQPRIVSSLGRTAVFAREDVSYLEKCAESAFESVPERKELAALPEAIRMRVLKRYLPYDSFDRNDLYALDALLTAHTGTVRNLKDGWIAYSGAHRLYVRKGSDAVYEFPLAIGKTVPAGRGVIRAEYVPKAVFPCGENEVFLDSDAIRGELTVRTPKDGDRFCPFGMRGSKLLSDFFTDRKVPRFDRSVPVVCDTDGIVAVMGYTIDERVKIADSTKTILRIVYEEEL